MQKSTCILFACLLSLAPFASAAYENEPVPTRDAQKTLCANDSLLPWEACASAAFEGTYRRCWDEADAPGTCFLKVQIHLEVGPSTCGSARVGELGVMDLCNHDPLHPMVATARGEFAFTDVSPSGEWRELEGEMCVSDVLGIEETCEPFRPQVHLPPEPARVDPCGEQGYSASSSRHGIGVGIEDTRIFIPWFLARPPASVHPPEAQAHLESPC